MSSSHSWKSSALTSAIPGGSCPFILLSSLDRRFDAKLVAMTACGHAFLSSCLWARGWSEAAKSLGQKSAFQRSDRTRRNFRVKRTELLM